MCQQPPADMTSGRGVLRTRWLHPNQCLTCPPFWGSPPYHIYKKNLIGSCIGVQLRITLIMEWSLFPSAEAVSINTISESSLVITRSRSDGSVVPLPLIGSEICWMK